MKQSITKIVDRIIQKLQESRREVPSEAGLRSWLRNEGYAPKDVEAAIRVIKPQLNSRSNSDALPQMRIYSPYESLFLTPEAKAALMRLEMYGIIGSQEREIILERVDQFDGELDLSALEYLVSTYVCSGLDDAHQQMIYQILDGKTDIFN
jgi:uncharacterized protein Smg (DUF494 family)